MGYSLSVDRRHRGQEISQAEPASQGIVGNNIQKLIHNFPIATVASQTAASQPPRACGTLPALLVWWDWRVKEGECLGDTGQQRDPHVRRPWDNEKPGAAGCKSDVTGRREHPKAQLQGTSTQADSEREEACLEPHGD